MVAVVTILIPPYDMDKSVSYWVLVETVCAEQIGRITVRWSSRDAMDER